MFHPSGPPTKLRIVRKVNSHMVVEVVPYSSRAEALVEMERLRAEKDIEQVRILT